MILWSWWLEVHGGTTKGGSTCFGYLVERGGVVTGRCHLVGGVSRDRIGDFGFKDAFDEILGLKMLLIEMHDLSAR